MAHTESRIEYSTPIMPSADMRMNSSMIATPTAIGMAM